MNYTYRFLHFSYIFKKSFKKKSPAWKKLQGKLVPISAGRSQNSQNSKYKNLSVVFVNSVNARHR